MNKMLKYLLILAVGMLFSTASYAADVSWTNAGTTGEVSDPTNWNSDPNLPTGSDDVYVNNGGTANVSTALSANALYLGRWGGGTGTLNLTEGSVSVASELVVGDAAGTGALTISGGSLNATYLDFGRWPGSTGTLTMTGGYVYINDWVSFGDSWAGPDSAVGNGTFTGNSQFYAAGSLSVGAFAYGVGNLTLGTAGGTDAPFVSSASTGIGNGGTGGITMNANSALTTGATLLATGAAGTSGTLTLNGGTYTTTTIAAGSSGATPTIIFNGGVLKAAADSTAFLSGNALALKVQAGGAKISSDFYAITVSLPFVNDAAGTDGGLTKLGSGTLALNSVSTYNGMTTVSEGTLQLKPGASLATTSITVADSATFDIGAPAKLSSDQNSLTLGNYSMLKIGISASAADPNAINVTKSGGANVMNFASGSGIANLVIDATGRSFDTAAYTVLNYGSKIGDDANLNVTLGPGYRNPVVVSKNVGATSTTIQVATDAAKSLVWTPGGVNTNWELGSGGAVPTWANWNDGSTQQEFYQFDSVSFTDAGGGGGLSLAGTLHPRDMIVDNSTNDYTFNGTGSITGVGTTLVKSGTKALTLNNSGGVDFTGNITLSGGGTLGTGASSGANKLIGNLQISDNSYLSVAGDPLTLTGVISDVADSGLRKSGAGVLNAANAANTYTGPTIIDGGTVQGATIADAGVACSIGASSNVSALTMQNGIFSYVGPTATVNRGFTVGGTSTSTEASISVITGTNLTMTGAIGTAGTPGIFGKKGAGTLTLQRTAVGTENLGASVRVYDGTLVFDGIAGTRFETAGRFSVLNNSTMILKGAVTVATTNNYLGWGYTTGTPGQYDGVSHVYLTENSTFSCEKQSNIGCYNNNTCYVEMSGDSTLNLSVVGGTSNLANVGYTTSSYFGKGYITMSGTSKMNVKGAGINFAQCSSSSATGDTVGDLTMKDGAKLYVPGKNTQFAYAAGYGNASSTVDLSGNAQLICQSSTAGAILAFGRGTKATATATLREGSQIITENAVDMFVGRNNGTSSLTLLDGAKVTCANNLSVGYNWSATVEEQGNHVMTVNGSGAEVAVTKAIIIGANSGKGTWNQNAGTTSSTLPVILAQGDYSDSLIDQAGAHGNAVLNLNGGVFVAPSLTTASKTISTHADDKDAVRFHQTFATVNLNGGTLKASADSLDFIATDDVVATLSLNVQKNATTGLGAVIDTQAFGVTLTKALAHDPTDGAPAIDGGLLKLGTGTLTLTGPIGYTGATVVDAGLLQIANGTTSNLTTITGAGSLKVADGSTLNATSINLDTLTIGGPATAVSASMAAVPEPGTFVLLALAAIGAILAWRRK